MYKPSDPICKLNSKRIRERTVRIERETGQPAWKRGLSGAAVEYLQAQDVKESFLGKIMRKVRSTFGYSERK